MVGTYTPIERLNTRARTVLVALLAFLMLAASGCDTAGQSSTTTDPVAPAQYGGEYAGARATGDTEAGKAFAQWVIDQDPQHQVITEAVVRGEETLGVKVQPDAMTKGNVRDLLVALTEGMAGTFPGKPLKVIAFYQSGDKLAEADFDPNTKQVSVNFSQ